MRTVKPSQWAVQQAKQASQIKQADPPLTSTYDPDLARRILMVKKILGAGLLGIGVGAGARGLVGVKNMLPTTEPLSAASQQSPIPSTVPVYLPAEQEEANGRLAKTAKQLHRALQHDGLAKLAADGLVDRALGACQLCTITISTDVGSHGLRSHAVGNGRAGAVGGWD